METAENRAVESGSKCNRTTFRRTRRTFDPQLTVRKFLQVAITDKQRLTFTYQKKVFLAVVPIEQVKLIEEIQTALKNKLELDSLMNVTEIERITDQSGHLSALKKLLQRVSITKEMLMVTYQDVLFIVMAPIEEKALMEEIEDCIDRQAVADAHNRGDIPIPLEEANSLRGCFKSSFSS